MIVARCWLSVKTVGTAPTSDVLGRRNYDLALLPRGKTLLTNAMNAEALAAMEKTGRDALVVVDRKGRFEGIVERDRVLSRMMLALVFPPSAA